MGNAIYKRIAKCRICGNKNLVKYLNLGKTPLANRLLGPQDTDKQEEKFPLEVMYCKNCSLSQLSILVSPRVLFSYYPYRSSISSAFRKHCAEMSNKISGTLKTKPNGLIVDIASNDGCLLQEFKKNNFRTLGIEPAKNLAKIAEENGIDTVNSFWNGETAEKIIPIHGKAQVIIATNVLAHVDNLNKFMAAVGILLRDDGLFIVEVPYLYDLISKNEFDTIYHEHLSYFLVKPLQKLYNDHGFTIVNIEKYPIHGGTIRVYASKKSPGRENPGKSVSNFLNFEQNEGMYSLKTYNKLDDRVKKIKKDLLKALKNLKGKGKKIAAYGASAKGSTLLNYCGIDNGLISFIVDDTPEKQNHLAPGSKIKIVDASYMEKNKPDYLLLLAWNFAKEIMEKTSKIYGKPVRYIIPVPKVKIQ
ncbi:class I SAM-dependent methyltransferase [Candidatus Woesearchaeota archaeon]|nr:class I SAM-dependent methyltransferase [Candidatus Woesearchaeota archaeon]